MRTYKQLQDAVLHWMADSGDVGLLRTLVKDAINRAHQNLLNDDRYDFMLWPRVETLAITPTRKTYTLHERYSQPLFFYNPEGDIWLEEIPAKGLMEAQTNWFEGTSDRADRFMLTGVAPVQQQPTTPGQLQVTSVGGQNPATCALTVTGLDTAGNVITETLGSNAAWSILYSTTTFALIESITKVSENWSAPITVTVNGETLLALNIDEYGRQYRVFELLETPTTAQTIHYRFYRRPRQLVNDNDLPDLPSQFDDILVYQALLAMSGYTRATPDEQQLWLTHVRRLTEELQMTYQASRSMGGRPTFTRYIPRVN